MTAGDQQAPSEPAQAAQLGDYEGKVLPAATLSLFEVLSRHGFKPTVSTGHAGKTINLVRNDTRFGYVNGTVLRNGVLGYHFAPMGNASNSCPDELLDRLVPEFCRLYKCEASDVFTHTRDSGGKSRTYLIIRSASVALRAVLQDAGLPVNESVVLPKIRGTYREGAMTETWMSRRERSGDARIACLEHYGYECQACDGNLKLAYQGLEKELIHVHHEDPLGDAVGERDVDPIRDLKPVCPNCHVVIHSFKPHLDINEVRAVQGLAPKAFPPRRARLEAEPTSGRQGLPVALLR